MMDDAPRRRNQPLRPIPGRGSRSHYTSVIAWMGFEAPHGASDLRVSEPGWRERAPLCWRRCQRSLGDPQQPDAPAHHRHRHSYGSTTVADAFAHNNMRASDAVLLGCPGTDLAHSAADFHLDGGHVYVGSASTDPITWIGESNGCRSNGSRAGSGNPHSSPA